ncbi:chemotaxis protein CheX [Ammoniphilus resinae]|uniref:Chemotaxis protein CheX n=1 Tax=Ammoniphilus resinae TaxID=861532 RepID=A0ABS4GJC8_9BACL|nr:chemotaxis protein CheX [Ammoniphilus resinae]MBP1930365.1 chemotaxis protein CheX [Ammoniphilus resinae]
MAESYINPFLDSAQLVIEQVCNVTPSRGDLTVKDIKLEEDHLWIKIGVNGQLEGDVIFGLHEQVALKIISAMMGGFTITEIDEIGKSAISELGNMISGNASAILYNQGINIDITPPMLLDPAEQNHRFGEGYFIPLDLGEIGQFHIQVVKLK